MKGVAVGFLSAIVFVTGLPGEALARHTVDFSQGWDFSPDGWDGVARKVSAPHDFQMEMPWSKESHGNRGFKPMGAAWYRNSFVTDGRWGDERVFLDFEGLMCIGDVWVNGKKVASTEYGYLGFEVDVTEFLNPAGGTNKVEVWTSTGHMYGSRWYTGGGLYRPVRIKTRPARSIARHGIFVTTPNVSSTSAAVRVRLELEGFRFDSKVFRKGDSFSAGTSSASSVVAAVTVADPFGRIVGESRCDVPMRDYRRRTEFVMPEITVRNPLLWDVDSPRLYSADVRLVKDGAVVDSDVARFGIRNIEFSPRFGFRLNGRKVFLKSIRKPNAPMVHFCGGTPTSSIAAKCPPSCISEASRQDTANPSGCHSNKAVISAGKSKLN